LRFAAHAAARVQNQPTVVIEPGEYESAVTRRALDRAAAERGHQPLPRKPAQIREPLRVHALDAPPESGRVHEAAEDLDIGKLGHRARETPRTGREFQRREF